MTGLKSRSAWRCWDWATWAAKWCGSSRTARPTSLRASVRRCTCGESESGEWPRTAAFRSSCSPATSTTLVSRDDVDIVVELMGPVEPAHKAILSALERGKSVVTANKALLAQSTGELAQAAERAHVDLYFEAAVAGAIPVIRPLTQSLAGDTVLRVAGIVNGTTNYILSEMDSTGVDYATALADASALGYAEADPTADVEGYDAAAKAAILASIAFHTRVTADDVYREGITNVTPADFASARSLGRTIKLLSICERIAGDDGRERVSARVYPRWFRWRIRWPPSTARSTPWWWKPKRPAG